MEYPALEIGSHLYRYLDLRVHSLETQQKLYREDCRFCGWLHRYSAGAGVNALTAYSAHSLDKAGNLNVFPSAMTKSMKKFFSIPEIPHQKTEY